MGKSTISIAIFHTAWLSKNRSRLAILHRMAGDFAQHGQGLVTRAGDPEGKPETYGENQQKIGNPWEILGKSLENGFPPMKSLVILKWNNHRIMIL
jgi:hypothetical protein